MAAAMKSLQVRQLRFEIFFFFFVYVVDLICFRIRSNACCFISDLTALAIQIGEFSQYFVILHVSGFFFFFTRNLFQLEIGQTVSR